MRDLVTGASGFIGAHLARALLARALVARGLAARDRPVRCLVRWTPLPEDLRRAGVEEVRGDITVPATLPAALDGVGRVFHCAARVSDWGDAADFRAVNVQGVENLLTAARTAGVARFIHLSTTDVYGFPGAPVDETAPFVRRGWPYGDTKIEAEERVWRCARESGLPVTVIRPASVYGVGSESFVGEIAARLRRRAMVHLGWRRRPAGLCHVDNLVDAILAAADGDRAVGQAYNVTDDSPLSWREFTNRLADALGLPRPRVTLPRPVAYGAGWALERVCAARRPPRRPLLTRMAVELFTSDQSVAIGKARDELGYAPRRTFAEALPELVAWLEGRAPC